MRSLQRKDSSIQQVLQPGWDSGLEIVPLHHLPACLCSLGTIQRIKWGCVACNVVINMFNWFYIQNTTVKNDALHCIYIIFNVASVRGCPGEWERWNTKNNSLITNFLNAIILWKFFGSKSISIHIAACTIAAEYLFYRKS